MKAWVVQTRPRAFKKMALGKAVNYLASTRGLLQPASGITALLDVMNRLSDSSPYSLMSADYASITFVPNIHFPLNQHGVSIRYIVRLAEAGVEPSVGSLLTNPERRVCMQ